MFFLLSLSLGVLDRIDDEEKSEARFIYLFDLKVVEAFFLNMV